MNDSSDTKNHSSMTEKIMDQQLWNLYSIASDNDRKFIDAKSLDEIAGNELANKYRTVKRLVSEMIDGTALEVDDLVRKIAIPRQPSHSIAVAAGIMQKLILRGFKQIPWNEKQRNLVKFLFSETMLPEYSPFSVINYQNRSTPPLEQLGKSSRAPTLTESATSQPLDLPSRSESSRSLATASLYRQHHIQFLRHVIPRKTTRKSELEKLQEWRTPKGSEIFWRQVLFCVRCHRISIQGLMEVAEKDSQRIKCGKGGRTKCRFTFSTLFIITRFFKKRGSSKDFKYDLAKATKTGNVDDIINTIRSRLEITGFKSFVLSPRHIRRATAEKKVHFTNFCNPEKTFSGFRSDLVSCVKAVAFLSLKTTELQGLRVDIWGDSCEIGGVEVTRLAFRLIY